MRTPWSSRARRHAHGDPVGSGKKDQVTGGQNRDIRFTERQIEVTAQIGEHIGHLGTRLAARCDGL